MNEALIKTCEDFLHNQNVLKKTFPFSMTLELRAVSAYYFLAQKCEANEEMLKLCKTIIRTNNGPFSSFRGNGEKIFTCMLAADEDPGTKMALALAAYEALRTYFPPNAYLTYLAMIMTDLVPSATYYRNAERTMATYNYMKNQHLFLTSTEDIPFAGLFSMNIKSNYTLVQESEIIYRRLEESFSLFSKNALQSVSHALALCEGNTETKCNNFYELYDLAYNSGLRYSHSFELVPLSILANLHLDNNKVVQDLCDVSEYLKSSYGIFSKSKRRQHAVMVCAAHYMNTNVELTSAVVVSALLEIQRQQQAAAAS